MIIQDIEPFEGEHCETTATGTLLKQIGITLSEPMLFGLGEGLGFIFWNMKTMDFPFIGGRTKSGEITKKMTANLKLILDIMETSSVKKARQSVMSFIDQGIIAGLQLDCYHLDYFKSRIHFAGHFVAMYGYDDEFAYLIDTQQQGGRVKTTLQSLEAARNEKGPMSSKNLMYTINKSDDGYDLKQAIITAIKNNVREYLNPPITNISYKGILKTSTEIKKWFNQSEDVKRDFTTTAMLMEGAGTGGALFRNLYRDFLKESYEILHLELLNDAYQAFTDIAELWSQVSSLLYEAGENNDINSINQASEILKSISEKEHATMVSLQMI